MRGRGGVVTKEERVGGEEGVVLKRGRNVLVRGRGGVETKEERVG